MTQYHSITCVAGECDPPRIVEYEVRGRPVSVTLPACPFWTPGFYEDDEPLGDVLRAFEEGEKVVTTPQPPCPT